MKHKIITFTPIIALATLIAVSLQLNEMLMMWKIQQAMQDDAELIRRIHPGNRAEVFIWQNFQPAYRDPGWKEPSQLFEHIENFTIDSEVRRDLGNRPSRAQMKRPLVCVAGARKLRDLGVRAHLEMAGVPG